MPANLLEELETTPQVTESLEYVEHLVHADAGKVGQAVKGMTGSAHMFESIWQRIVVAVAKGQTVEMQGARSRLLAAFEKRLRLLKDAHAVASWMRERGSEEIPDPDVLLQDIAGMERLKGSVFDCWQSADDLEDLAARDYPLTTADLDQIGPTLRPPASFYAEEQAILTGKRHESAMPRPHRLGGIAGSAEPQSQVPLGTRR